MTDVAGQEQAPVLAPERTDAPRMALQTVGLFAGLTVVLSAFVGFLQPFAFQPRSIAFLTGPAWLDGWFQYDSGWYHQIATEGYAYTPGQQSSVAFFPSYPLLVRAVATVPGDTQVAGTLVTVLSGAAAAVLFGWWARRWLSSSAAWTAVLLLLLYPYAFFLYGTMYSDAFFLLTVLGAFVLLERGHPVLAGLVGAVAAAGRPVGIAVAVGLVVRMLEIHAENRAATGDDVGQGRAAIGQGRAALGQGRTAIGQVSFRSLTQAVRAVRTADLGVLLSVLGLAGWCTYLWLAFGNPLAFVAAEAAPGWDQGSGWRTWFKVALLGQLLWGSGDIKAALLVQAVICLIAVLLLRRVWRRFGWGYLAYCLVVVGIPLLGSKDFMGTGRYLIAAFPVIAAAGDGLAASRHARWLRPTVLAVCAVGLVLGTSLYARGYEVS